MFVCLVYMYNIYYCLMIMFVCLVYMYNICMLVFNDHVCMCCACILIVINS